MRTSIRGLCMLTADIDSPTGGVQAQSVRLLRELSDRHIETYVCTRNYHRLKRQESREDVHIRRSPVVNREMSAANSCIYQFDAVAWLLLHRSAYDVIHCQQMFGPAMAALMAKPLTKKPVVVRVSSTGELGEVAGLRRMPLSALRIKQLKNVDHWVALTRQMASEIETIGISHDRISIIPNAAVLPPESAADPSTRNQLRQKLKLRSSKIAVYSGRLSSEKNLDVLLSAWVKVQEVFPDAHLLLAGAGGSFRNVEDRLRQMTEELQIKERVHFLGHVNNVFDHLLAADVFVLPTSTEGMSNSLVEAMAAGNAIITTDIEANREVVSDGETALLVPPRDVEALSGAIIRILQSPELGYRLGARARERAAQRHSVNSMTDAYLNIYEQVVSRSRVRRPIGGNQ